ncbi:sensor histidine kinase [Calidifontibacillus oryziterrae]|uniref:sensor histidine kinase n=1 Tax=Calidifontibacillus oryziterrae TaxID=1191699 RepID=UPI0002D8EEDD|nr:sensor histidine kinase [Calidifontibacillus oryziterrae]
MLLNYLKERLSWILLVLSIQFLILFVAYLDLSIPLLPMLYIVFLSLLVFTIFLFVRYKKETKYFKSLQDWEHDLDLAKLIAAESPFEKIVENSLTSQTVAQKEIATNHLIALEQEKDDLLAWIHEVKTPLTAMHLMIERIEDPQLKSQLAYEWLRIHLLLDQQLHQKRLRFIENDLHIEKIALEPIIFKEIRELQSWCMQKGIGFEVNLSVHDVLSDSKWLAYIIRQVVTNAVKYSEQSDIHINSYDQDGQTFLEISDFGRGIASKDVSRIFEKGFTTTSLQSSNSGAATGMGLYLAQKAARFLRIHIGVTSELGKGSTFTLTFPKKNEFVNITGM